MPMLPFIWLGARRTRKYPVAAPARLLDTAASRGLPVPAGGILLHEFYALLLREGVLLAENGRLHTPDPAWLHETLFDGARFPRLPGAVTVRPAAAPALGLPPISLDDAPRLAAALTAAWSATPAAADRRDLLLVQSVAAAAAGTAVCEAAYQDDLVQVFGKQSSVFSQLPRINPWERPSAAAPPHARRLQQLLRGVRRTFGDADWEIEWADDGRICWLLGLRPLAAPPPRQDTFAFEPLRALLPPPPPPADLAAAAAALLADLRRIDPGLPANRPLVVVRNGRALLNLSLLADVRRRYGLPTANTPARPLRRLRHAVPLLRLAWRRRRANSPLAALERELTGSR